MQDVTDLANRERVDAIMEEIDEAYGELRPAFGNIVLRRSAILYVMGRYRLPLKQYQKVSALYADYERGLGR